MLNANRNCFHGFQIQNFQIEIYCDNFSKDDYQGILPRNNNHGNWPSQKINWHINILELSILIAVKLALIIFTKEKKVNSIHFQIDNTTALKYLNIYWRWMKKLSKEIWEYCLFWEVRVTAEYLSSSINVPTGQEYQKWKLNSFQAYPDNRENK